MHTKEADEDNFSQKITVGLLDSYGIKLKEKKKVDIEVFLIIKVSK